MGAHVFVEERRWTSIYGVCARRWRLDGALDRLIETVRGAGYRAWDG